MIGYNRRFLYYEHKKTIEKTQIEVIPQQTYGRFVRLILAILLQRLP